MLVLQFCKKNNKKRRVQELRVSHSDNSENINGGHSNLSSLDGDEQNEDLKI